ncbi:hypothetical protein MPY17_39915 (plasmid) [Rhodococcus opacus]|uniref:hypothetical protein n=1 Tax=Rhodococcus opacus TaxID=37919 RepID=UPI001FF4DE43|nr:hypothetical protein [Rhodococcus opacus]UOT08434.1 hypothetical protein MPY17_39915 [Rhodococcus opacus]
MIAFSSTVLLAEGHLPAGAPDEGEFPLFVVLAILALLAVMAIVAAHHHRADKPDEFSDIAGRYESTRHETAARPEPEPLGHPLDRIDP